jgi:putative intracellular protease/amidase
MLSHALFPSTTQKIFTSTLASSHSTIITGQKLTITPDISLSVAYSTLSSYDILIIPGGGTEGILKEGGGEEPMGLIRAFSELPKKEKEEGGRDLLNGERILFSVCTGSLFLATAGAFDAPELKVTTHPVFYQNLRDILTSRGEEGEGKVTKDRFVVNKVNEKGVRIVTCGGVTSGFHGALWLVGFVGGAEARRKVEEIVVFEGVEGLIL